MAIDWHGTQAESTDLLRALSNNCGCEFGLMNIRLTTCKPHDMLAHDQRALNGLLFARRIRDRLNAEEHDVPDWHPHGEEWLHL